MTSSDGKPDGVTYLWPRTSGHVNSTQTNTENKFTNWTYHWDSKEEVIDALLDELERSMEMGRQSQKLGLKVVGD